MGIIVFIVALTLAGMGLLLSAFLMLETLASLFARKPRSVQSEAGDIVVIIPAHNEALTIPPTLVNIREQLRDGDRMLVVADNCSDNTAEIARNFGADVVERNDPTRRGKGYALQFALDALSKSPPDIVVFMDADCVFEEGALQRIAAVASDANRPVQGLYLMNAPSGTNSAPQPRLQVAAFAWLFINQVRMRGLQRIFDVTRFTGAGLAVPWQAVSDINLGSGEIVEDLAFTYDLIRKDRAPLLFHDAVVESEFPESNEALTRQAARWSIGSLRYAIASSLGLLVDGFSKGQWRLVGAAIDLMIPPLTIFVALLLASTGLGLFAWVLTGTSAAFSVALCALILTGVSIIIGWARFGQTALPPSAISGVVRFILSKFAVFGTRGRQSAKGWTPTRDSDDPQR